MWGHRDAGVRRLPYVQPLVGPPKHWIVTLPILLPPKVFLYGHKNLNFISFILPQNIIYYLGFGASHPPG